MIFDVKSGLDFVYKGFQYPVPPSWKYAVRIQDQINWLLQAILALDAAGVSTDELTDAVTAALDAAKAYVDAKDEKTREELDKQVSRLESMINSVMAGAYFTRNPVDGFHEPIYVALKMMYDSLRIYALTWAEVSALDKTYDEIKADAHTWIELDLFSGTYYGDGQPHAKWTDPENVDTETPGYFSVGTTMVGRTWDDISSHGFLMYGGA